MEDRPSKTRRTSYHARGGLTKVSLMNAICISGEAASRQMSAILGVIVDRPRAAFFAQGLAMLAGAFHCRYPRCSNLQT